jgi:hypothetical protein
MKKMKARKNNARIKRKNQTSRIRAVKANKKNVKGFLKKSMHGDAIAKDTIGLYSKHIYSNQAQP